MRGNNDNDSPRLRALALLGAIVFSLAMWAGLIALALLGAGQWFDLAGYWQ